MGLEANGGERKGGGGFINLPCLVQHFGREGNERDQNISSLNFGSPLIVWGFGWEADELKTF